MNVVNAILPEFEWIAASFGASRTARLLGQLAIRTKMIGA